MPPSDRPRPRPSGGANRGSAPTPSGRGGGAGRPARPGAKPARPGPAQDRNPGKSHTRDGGEPGPAAWGALARRGSRRLAEDVRDMGNKPPQQGPPAPKEAQDVWVRDEVRTEASEAVQRGQRPATRPAPARGPKTPGAKGPASKAGAARRGKEGPPADDRAEAELARAVGTARAARSAGRLKDATRAFEREQYSEARRLLRPLAEDAPGASAVRELLGLSYYRMGQWTQAVRELEAFRDLTGSTEQHPVLADCYRALKRWPAVEDLWEELREASPAPDLVAEGRIVMAGALADRGRLADAIALLDKAKRDVKRPQVHHLRTAYVLADLRERAGDVPRARELFLWVARTEPDFADAALRASQLR